MMVPGRAALAPGALRVVDGARIRWRYLDRLRWK